MSPDGSLTAPFSAAAFSRNPALAFFSVSAPADARAWASAWIFGPKVSMSTWGLRLKTPSLKPAWTSASSDSLRLNEPTFRASARPRAYSVFSSSVFGSGPAAPSGAAATMTPRTTGRDLLHITSAPFTPGARGRPGSRPRLGSVLVLERDLHLGAIRSHLAVLDLQVELRDLGDAQDAQRLGRLVDGGGRGLLPRVRAGPDQLDHLVDALRHGSSFRQCRASRPL